MHAASFPVFQAIHPRTYREFGGWGPNRLTVHCPHTTDGTDFSIPSNLEKIALLNLNRQRRTFGRGKAVPRILLVSARLLDWVASLCCVPGYQPSPGTSASAFEKETRSLRPIPWPWQAWCWPWTPKYPVRRLEYAKCESTKYPALA